MYINKRKGILSLKNEKILRTMVQNSATICYSRRSLVSHCVKIQLFVKILCNVPS